MFTGLGRPSLWMIARRLKPPKNMRDGKMHKDEPLERPVKPPLPKAIDMASVSRNRVVTLFNSISGHNWSKIQLRNHRDAMRREHKRLTELLSCTGVEYNTSDGRIVVSEEWWNRKIKKNNDFKDKDISEIYTRYHQLFGDSYDGDKYAVIPTKLCRTGFGLFEDSAVEDHRDIIPINGESTGSSDKDDEGNCTSSMNTSEPRSDEKRKSGTSSRKGKKKKVSANKLSYSVDRANNAAKEVAVKINTIMALEKNAGMVYVEELLEVGWLKRGTNDAHPCTSMLVCFGTALLSRRARRHVDEKSEWIEWQFNERNKSIR